MSPKKISIIVIITITGFIIWSLVDMDCRPCPEGATCPDACFLEPRWVTWLRGWTFA